MRFERLQPDHPIADMQDLPVGLHGYFWEGNTRFVVPLIATLKGGSFMTFLRELENKGKRVFFPCVIHGRLQRLLELRGYKPALVWDEQMQCDVDGMIL